MSEETEDKATKKMHSRKFMVWITATVFELGALAYAFISQDATMALQVVPWWGGISMVYIGANAAQKFAQKPEEPGQEE